MNEESIVKNFQTILAASSQNSTSNSEYHVSNSSHNSLDLQSIFKAFDKLNKLKTRIVQDEDQNQKSTSHESDLKAFRFNIESPFISG